MKLNNFKSGILMLLFAAGLSAASCKSKEQKTEEVPAVDTTATMPADNTMAQPEIATDDTLTVGVKDAVKDFPGVTATVTDGEVTLEGGPVTRDQLQTIMQSVNSLHPKKVNNNLTIKK